MKLNSTLSNVHKNQYILLGEIVESFNYAEYLDVDIAYDINSAGQVKSESQ